MTDYPADSMIGLLAKGADDAPAIGTPGKPWLTHGGLRSLVGRTVKALNAMGIGRGDRVALVVPNGPEAASAFVTIACGATTAPLNPGYKRDEFAFYLGDLKACALVIQAGMESPARQAAAALNLPVVELVPDPDGPAGWFTLTVPRSAATLTVPQSAATLTVPRSAATLTAPQGAAILTAPPSAAAPTAPQGAAGAAWQGGMAEAEDVALVLHTSGTTSRPKIVPLRHINVTASAYHIGETLALGPDDVCLNIMPLFHIHGLIAATLSSLAAGGAVCCSTGFNGFRFFTWFSEVRPTWYTAVPTMHQAILDLAPRHKAAIEAGRLRFIRSSSASLPAPVMTAMEAMFGVPVIESYGMTEASHQMASNPLPPRPRFPGCVGIAAGPEVAIMDDAGELLPSGGLGEVVIRGRNVTSGYENNPAANASAFINGWFRTGDQGIIDQDGYLRLTGRLKELINRGGEKISPLEVDDILMEHPGVAQCVTFAMPHAKLGEEVAAAIVLRDGATLKDTDLREFCSTRLAAFKVPRKIVFVDKIPVGATGKLRRIDLAERLGLSA